MVMCLQLSRMYFAIAIGAFTLGNGVGVGLAAPLTLPQALTLAEGFHPQLRAGVAQIEAAQASLITARAYPNPAIGGLARGQTYRVPDHASGPVYSFVFAQPLELGSLRPSRIALAERGRELPINWANAASRKLSMLSGSCEPFVSIFSTRSSIATRHTQT
jgi:hypothetical protein